MIVTLTANPSIDHTIALDAPLERGEVQRVAGVIAQAGGKGVNICRAAVAAGVPTCAIVPAEPHDPFVGLLEAASVPAVLASPAAPVRTNVAVTEPDGTTTKLNSPGDFATPRLLDQLGAAVVEQASTADWVVLAGSLPPGAPAAWYAELVAALRSTPARVAVDTSDAPLLALAKSLHMGAPDLMKPNGEELASLVGSDPDAIESDAAAAASAAQRLVDEGVGAVLATLGSSGAVLVTESGAWHATPPPVEVVSTVGAGDSSLFGYLLGDRRGADPADRLALAVAYGSAAASLPGTTIPGPGAVEVERATVRMLARPQRTT